MMLSGHSLSAEDPNEKVGYIDRNRGRAKYALLSALNGEIERLQPAVRDVMPVLIRGSQAAAQQELAFRSHDITDHRTILEGSQGETAQEMLDEVLKSATEQLVAMINNLQAADGNDIKDTVERSVIEVANVVLDTVYRRLSEQRVQALTAERQTKMEEPGAHPFERKPALKHRRGERS